MTKSEMFRKAHALTKQAIRLGVSYQVTFAAALRELYQEAKTVSTITVTEASRRTGKPMEAENDLFSWSWVEAGYLRCKKTGRLIYQMAYMHKTTFGSDPITDEATITAVRAFWAELRAIEQDAASKIEAEQIQQIRQGREATTTQRRAWDNLYNEGAEGFNPYA